MLSRTPARFDAAANTRKPSPAAQQSPRLEFFRRRRLSHALPGKRFEGALSARWSSLEELDASGSTVVKPDPLH